LQDSIEAIADDRLDPEALWRTLGANVEALRRCGIDLTSHVSAWRDRLVETETCRANDGNVVRRRGECWGPLADLVGSAERDVLPFLGPDGRLDPASPPRGIVIEGIEPAALLRRIARETALMYDGFRVPLLVVQQDAQEALDALSISPLTDLIEQDRVFWFIGSQASAALARRCRRSLHLSLPSHYVRSPGLRTPAVPPIPMQVQEASAAQQREHVRLVGATAAAYAARGPESWAERIERASAAAAPTPLRVLLPATRYSTFVRHCASDLAEALRALGHEARVLMEPDDHSRLASVAYLREVDEWRPDLVVLINYTRHHLRKALPPGLPVVCWVQDRMAQLFDDAAGAAQGPLDFLVGHIHPDLLLKHGYPRERTLPWFVPASETKFHGAPAPEALRRRFECDIAYVSHQSESPRATHERLARSSASQPGVRSALEEIFRRLEVSAGTPGFAALDLRVVASEALASRGLAPSGADTRLLDAVVAGYAMPIAERLYRHAALEWAAGMAGRRGWRLGLFGRGWEAHPTLSAFARGPVHHDEELRALYQVGLCHLHVSRNSNAHQRVFECALSGGLMLRRGPSPDAFSIVNSLLYHLRRSGVPAERLADGTDAYALDPQSLIDLEACAHPALRPAPNAPDGSARAVLHVPSGAAWGWTEPYWSYPVKMFPDAAFPAARQTIFCNEHELERAVERAVSDGPWRASTIEAQAHVVREHCTMEVFARAFLRFVAEKLRAGAGGVVAPKAA